MVTTIRTIVLAALAVATASHAFAQGTLRVGLTAADTPVTTGIPNYGYEGINFAGYPVFESLIGWDLSSGDQTKQPALVPRLATAWTSDPLDRKTWIFTLREGVKFQDGSPFDADAVIWNLARLYDDKAPQYDVNGAALTRSRVPMIDGWKKRDDHTVEIHTKSAASYFPYLMTLVTLVSPAAFEASHSWAEFAKSPAGTGPFKITKVTSRVSIEMQRNDAYWDAKHRAKLDKIVLMPMPDPNTRVAALRAGQVDWIEVPPPEAVPSLKQAGMNVTTLHTPAVWIYALQTDPGSPFSDKRVRLAVNYAIDRDALTKLLNGIAAPAVGFWYADDPNFGNPQNRFTYDPTKARELLGEAGYGPGKPLQITVKTATGSGQLLPVQMGQAIQRWFADVGIEMKLQVVDFPQLIAGTRQPPGAAINEGISAMNYTIPATDYSQLYRFFHSRSVSPNSANWGQYKNPALDAVLDELENEFDPVKIGPLIRKAHEMIVDDAPAMWGVHDLSARAMSPKVKGFVGAKSPFTDLTLISVQ